MKVVIWKPGMAVFWNKSQDISTTMRDMKNLKIGFCRGDFVLFDGMIEYTVLGYKKGSKKFWSHRRPSKNGGFHEATKYLGGFCNMVFEDMIWSSKQL